MSNSRTLPAELIRPILHHISDPAPLAALCLSSKLLQCEAQRILYHSPTHFPTTLRPRQHILLLTTLAHNPRLAALVRTHHVPSLMGRYKPAVGTLLRLVLPLLTNLTDLALIASSEEIAVLPMHRVLCQLTTLAWIQVDADPAGVFSRWLETQKALTKLKWICRRAVEVAPGAVPQLESLEGNLHVIRALLPGRRVKRLHWIADIAGKGCSMEESLKKISGGLGGLEWLSFESHFNAVEYHSVVEHLTSLMFLELVGDNHAFFDDILLPPNLHVLTLSPHVRAKNALLCIAQRSTFVGALFAKSGTLLRVDIAAKLEGGDVFYERWEQGVKREGIVSSKDIGWA